MFSTEYSLAITVDHRDYGRMYILAFDTEDPTLVDQAISDFKKFLAWQSEPYRFHVTISQTFMEVSDDV